MIDTWGYCFSVEHGVPAWLSGPLDMDGCI